jgi:hypothetical protein
MVTQKQVATKSCSDEKPMEITITPKPKPIINTAPICNNLLLVKPIPIA